MRNFTMRLLLLLSAFLLGLQAYAQKQPWLEPKPTENQATKIVFDATGTPLAGAAKVYAHHGVVVDGPTGTAWTHVVGEWGKDDGVGQMTKQAGTDNVWELAISPSVREYFKLAEDESAYRISVVFRSADGNKKGFEKDIYLDLNIDFTVYFTQPTRKEVMISVNEAMGVTAKATEASTITLAYDGKTEQATAVTTLSRVISFPNPGTYKVVATADNGKAVKTQEFSVFVTGPSPAEKLPAGMQDGINYDAQDATKATLVLYAPNKQYVYLIGEMNDWKAAPAYLMKRDGDRFWMTLTGLTPNKEYMFQYLLNTGKEVRPVGDPYSQKVLTEYDKYISAESYPNPLAYPEGKTIGNVSVLQTGQQPYAWKVSNFQRPAKDKLVVYELLVRDFDTRENYQAIIEKLDYIKGMGFNAIELMPVTEFYGNDSWGYNPTFYFAADKAYGTKQMLQAFVDKCHEKGIAVIVDMVYNHAHEHSPLVGMYFDWSTYKPLNNPWANTEATHPFNVFHDFNHEAAYIKQYFDRVNKFWLQEFKVDGFRFDLTKGFTQKNSGSDVGAWSAYDASRVAILNRMVDEIYKVDANAYVIFEHLGTGTEEQEYQKKGVMLWGNMNHNFRELIKGYPADLAWIAQAYKQQGVMTYMESHDEERLMADALKYGKTGSYNLRNLATALEHEKSLAALYFLTPGPKMVWQFGELGYDVSIDENGRTGRKPVKWEYLQDANRLKLSKVYGELIKLRTREPLFTEGMKSNFQLGYGDNLKRVEFSKDGVDAYLIANTSVAERSLNFNAPMAADYYDYFSGKALPMREGSNPLTLAPGQFVLLSTKKLGTPEAGLLAKEPEVITSVEDSYLSSKLTVAPNPSSGRFSVKLQGQLLQGAQVKVLDAIGQTVYSARHSAQDGQFELNLERLPAGIYFLQVQTSEGKAVRRILKM